jgi:hypothetical protein
MKGGVSHLASKRPRKRPANQNTQHKQKKMKYRKQKVANKERCRQFYIYENISPCGAARQGLDLPSVG